MTALPHEIKLTALKRSIRKLAALPTEGKNNILREIAKRIFDRKDEILEANQKDLMEFDQASSRPKSLRDRLEINPHRIQGMIKSVETLASLPDPVGEIIHSRVLENGLSIRQVRSPLGVILVIFESRPNIIPEVFGLSFKAGNAVCLRGGSEAKSTNRVLYDILHSALETQLPLLDSAGTPPANRPLPFYGIDDYDRGLIGRLLQRSDIFDVCIPRGGDELIKRVSAESQIPIIKNDRGLCHLYIHEDANLDMALKIAINAKTQRPSVCNSIETIIIDRKIARDFFKVAIPALFELGVHFAGCEESIKILKNNTDSIAKTDGIDSAWASSIEIADARAFAKEYLDLKLNLKVVEGFELALHHIGTFGSKHSECIITQNEAVAREFLQIVDAACVYWNASTRFTDGFELGLGGEIGISTQKLHVRGPVGLRELTSARWIIEGHGEVRL